MIEIITETIWTWLKEFFGDPGVSTMATLASAIWAVWYMSQQIKSDKENFKLQLLAEQKRQFIELYNKYEMLIMRVGDELNNSEIINAQTNPALKYKMEILSTFANATALSKAPLFNLSEQIREKLNTINEKTCVAFGNVLINERIREACKLLSEVRPEINKWYQRDIEDHLN